MPRRPLGKRAKGRVAVCRGLLPKGTPQGPILPSGALPPRVLPPARGKEEEPALPPVRHRARATRGDSTEGGSTVLASLLGRPLQEPQNGGFALRCVARISFFSCVRGKIPYSIARTLSERTDTIRNSWLSSVTQLELISIGISSPFFRTPFSASAGSRVRNKAD